MNQMILFLAVSFFVLTSCDDDETNNKAWEVGFSAPADIALAEGEVVQQNDVPLTTYVVEEAYLVEEEDNYHALHYLFTSGDVLDLIILKRTADYNYHFPEDARQNFLRYAIFNEDTLEIEASAVSIQPRKDENKFHTVVNVHTVGLGDFNGTVNHVPRIRKEDLD